jgi:hypothetical protein
MLFGTIMEIKMIMNIKELQEFVLRDLREEDEDIFQRSCLLTSPGCSKEEIENLKRKLPGIPDSYTKWIETFNLNGISVGYFEVCPTSFNPEGMITNLIDGNEDGVLFSEIMRDQHLYSIATIDGLGVFVATLSSPYKEGEIVAIDESIYTDGNNPGRWVNRLAKDFEQFLIVAGNLNQVHREIKNNESNREEKKCEFSGRLKKLKVSEEYHTTWINLF